MSLAGNAVPPPVVWIILVFYILKYKLLCAALSFPNTHITGFLPACRSRIFIHMRRTWVWVSREPTLGINPHQAVRVTTISVVAFDALVSIPPGASWTTWNQAVRCRRIRRGPPGSKSGSAAESSPQASPPRITLLCGHTQVNGGDKPMQQKADPEPNRHPDRHTHQHHDQKS